MLLGFGQGFAFRSVRVRTPSALWVLFRLAAVRWSHYDRFETLFFAFELARQILGRPTLARGCSLPFLGSSSRFESVFLELEFLLIIFCLII